MGHARSLETPATRRSLAVTAPPRARALLLAASLLASGTASAEGLRLPSPDARRWQARIELTRLSPSDGAGSARLLSANLLGDYYLTGSLLGEKLTGGLRATGGLLLGSSSTALAPPSLPLGSRSLSVGQHNVGLLGGSLPVSADPGSVSYLGIGYTGLSLRGGWGFSADLGLLRFNHISELRLGRSTLQGADEVLGDMRFRPTLQLGLSYSY